jgi:hypothetical protein
MGYRSQVVLALDAKVVPALMTIFAECEETRKLCTRDTDELVTDYDGPGHWMMMWDSIKWYDSYPEIAKLNAFIDALEADDLSDYGMDAVEDHDGGEYAELYSFVRIGEDDDDLTRSGYGFESVGISRSIHY